jgi:myo-inositol-hexaphosphate 3-phosphohydrolase
MATEKKAKKKTLTVYDMNGEVMHEYEIGKNEVIDIRIFGENCAVIEYHSCTRTVSGFPYYFTEDK